MSMHPTVPKAMQVLTIVALAVLFGCASVGTGGGATAQSQSEGQRVLSGSPSAIPTIVASGSGARIFADAASDSGQTIKSQGGPAGGMPGHQLTCDGCHGAQGQGGKISRMMISFEAPNITWPVLTNPTRSDHPPYTEETVKRAIVNNLDPSGQPLDHNMPRYSISEQDLDDLVAFLKTLK